MESKKQIKKKELLKLLEDNSTYLLILISIILTTILWLTNHLRDKAILAGSQTYFHLNQATIPHWFNAYHALLNLTNHLGISGFLALTITLNIITIYLITLLAKQFAIGKKFSITYLVLLIFSPVFIFTYSTLSYYAFYIPLALSGFLLLTSKKKTLQYLSTIPFLLATSFDALSSLILFILLTVYFSYTNKNKKIVLSVPLVLLIVLILVQIFVLNQTLMPGPFQQQNVFENIFSDLGSISGLSVFAIVLSIIGISVTWKRKELLTSYIILPFLILNYFLAPATNTLFTLGILIFAAQGFLKLFNREWSLNQLKEVTIFLILLGLLFSTLTYMDRFSEISISNDEIESLAWISHNTPKQALILSDLKSSNQITYFSKRATLEYPHRNNNLTNRALSATNIAQLFPILEKNKVSIIYVSADMKQNLPQEYGLLFILSNERFKLLHTSKDSEVWGFE